MCCRRRGHGHPDGDAFVPLRGFNLVQSTNLILRGWKNFRYVSDDGCPDVHTVQFFCVAVSKEETLNMAWCNTTVDGVCWVLAVVVVAVLIFLGCSELRKTSAHVAARRAASARIASRADAKGGSKADDAVATHPTHPTARTKTSSVHLDDAFMEFEVDPSLTRVVPENAYAVPDHVFMQEFVDGDKTAFRPIDKETALKSANTRPSQHMQNGRDHGAKARTVGLYGMAFAGRGPIERPVGSSSCIAFHDTDTRQHHALKADAECGDNCPYAP